MLRLLCLTLFLRGAWLMDNSSLEISIDTIPPGPIFPVAAIVSFQCSVEMEHSVEYYDWEFYCIFKGDMIFVNAINNLSYPGGYNLHFLSTSDICIDVVVCSATDTLGNVGEASVVLSNVTGVGLVWKSQSPLPNNIALFSDTSGQIGTITCHSASSDSGIGKWLSPNGLEVTTNTSGPFEVGFSVGRVHSFTSIEVQRESFLSENDTGVYACVIPDEYGELFTLNLGLYHNSYNGSLRWISAGRVSENPFTLSCTSTDLPATAVSWEDATQETVFMEGEDYHIDLVVDDRVTSTYTSFLTMKAPLDDALLYACVFTSSMIYPDGSQSETTIVHFLAILQVGRTESVSCLINASRVEWTFNGELYSTDNDIHIFAEDTNHNRVFICTGYSSESQIVGTEYITAIINVPQTAITLSTSGNTQVILGELLQVQCIVRYNVGGLSNTASLDLLDRNNDTVSDGSASIVIGINSNELTLTASFGSALIAQAGQYTCISALSSPALDSPLEKSLPLSITVQMPTPVVSLAATPSTILLSGSDVQLTCRSEISASIEMDITVSILWKKDGEEIESSSSDTIEISDVQKIADRIYESILTLKSASSSQDSGTVFTCESFIATNSTSHFILGSQTATAMVSLTVNVPTLTVSTSPDMLTILSVPPYNEVTVTCNIMAQSEIEFIIWNRENVESGEIVALSQNNASVNIVTVNAEEPLSYYSRLTINDSIPGHYVYTCTAKIVLPRDDNVIEFASTEIIVKGPQAPTKPTNIEVSSVTSESADISWIVPYIAFTPEHYTVYYGSEESNLDNSITKFGTNDTLAVNTVYTITLKNLLPDTLYYYRIVSNNSELSAKTIINTFTTLASDECSTIIQLVFGEVHDCNEWRFDETDVLLQEVQSSVIAGVNSYCTDQCELVPSSLSRAEFLCGNENTEVVFYRVMLSGEGEAYCSSLVTATEGWVRGEASVLVSGNRIFINPTCTIVIESFSDPIECVMGATSPTTMLPQQRSSAVIGAGIGVALTLVAVSVAIIVIVVIVVRLKRNKQRDRIANAEYSMNSAYGRHTMDSTMSESQLNNPLYRDHQFIHQEGTGSYINYGPHVPNQVDREGYTFMNPNFPDPPSYSEVAKMMEASTGTYSELTSAPGKSSELPLPPIHETEDQESLYEEIGPGSLQTDEQEIENECFSASFAANPLYGSSATK